MKRFVSIFLILSFIMSIICSIGVSATDMPTNNNEFEVSFLKKLEIIPHDMKGENILTREQMAKILVALVYPGLEASELNGIEDMFEDVEPSSEYFDYIAFLKRNKVISGDGNNNFNPGNGVSSDGLVTMLINALGYTVYAEAFGGYPTGYYIAAKNCGILNNVQYNATSELTVNEASKYIFNSLFADVTYLENISDDGINISIDHNKDLLSFAHGIEEYDAWVVDDGITAINDDSINSDTDVVIEDFNNGVKLIVNAENVDVKNCLGSRIRAFVKTDSETEKKELIHYEIHRTQKEVTINSHKITGVTSSYIEYEENEETGKYKKYYFGETPIFVLNGIHKNTYQFSDMKPDDGLLKLIDRDGNGRYELVKTYDFNYSKQGRVPARNIVADGQTSNGTYINCKFNSLMKINNHNDEYILKIVSSDGIKSVSDIKENDIISVAEAKEKVNGKILLNLVVSRNVVEGVLNSVSDNSLFVDDKEYDISSSILSQRINYASSLAINNKIKIYLDVTGKIAYSEGADTGKKNYGYILSYGVGNEFEPYVKIKYYNTDDEIITANISPKAVIDGKRHSSTSEQIAALNTRPENLSKLSAEDTSVKRPFVYELNSEGMVTKIDTDTPNYETDENAFNFYTTQTSIGYSDDEVYDNDAFKAGFRMPATAILRDMTLMGKAKINSTTTIINVPDIDTFGIGDYAKLNTANYYNYSDAAKNAYWIYQNAPLSYELIKLHEGNITDENYKLLTASMLSNSYTYDIQVYDVDADTGVAGFAVIRGNTTNYAESSAPTDSKLAPMYVYLETREAYDTSKKRIVSKLYYTKDGVNKEYALFDKDELKFEQRFLLYGSDSSENLFGVSIDKLKQGDIIRVMKNGEWMYHLERVMVPDKIDTMQALTAYPTQFRYRYSLGYDTNEIPGDVNKAAETPDKSWHLQLSYTKCIRGNTLQAIMPTTASVSGTEKYLSTVKLSDPSTYSIILLDISSVNLTILEKQANGEYKPKKGSFADIKTIDETGGTENADVLFVKQTGYRVQEAFLIKD